MSRADRRQQRDGARAPAAPAVKSDSALAGGFKAAGLCRTVNGWAMAVVELDNNGQLVGITLGPSQGYPEPVARGLVAKQMALNQEMFKRYPWRPPG